MPADGRVYLLIGSGYDAINKDFTSFIVNTSVLGDLESDSDAGTTMETGMPMTLGRHEKNHLSPTDLVDVYSFTGKKGLQLRLGFVPFDTDESWMTFTIADSYKQTVFEGRASKGQGFRSDTIILPEDDTYYLTVKQDYGIEKSYRYMLELKDVTPVPNTMATTQTGTN